MRFSFQIELYWSLRTPLSLVNVCNELFDGEDEFLTEREPEETTTIKGTLRWSTVTMLGGIDGNPVKRGKRKRICTRTRDRLMCGNWG